MKINILNSLYALVAALTFATCVREVDFKSDDVDVDDLVVSGGFYDSEGPFYLRLSRPTDYDLRDFEPVAGADVALLDDIGNQYAYQEVDPLNQAGLYELKGVRGTPGRTYVLTVQSPDGKSYRSRPQKMPASLPVDSVEMRFRFVEDIDSKGDIVKIPFAEIYAHSTVQGPSDGRYLRWEGESTYIFNEFDTGNPFDPPKQCFVTNGVSAQVVAIVDPGIYQPGAALSEYAGRRKVDYAFDFRNCFSLYQRTLSKDAYEYWYRVRQITQPTGTIFDAPPAIIRGNLENIDDPSRPAFGLFEVGASDTTRLCVNRGDLPFDVVAYIPVYCSKTNPAATLNPECLECLLIPRSTLQIPDWW